MKMIMKIKSRFSFLFVGIFLNFYFLSFTSCTKVNPEITFNSSIEPIKIESLTISSSTNSVNLSGKCEKRVQSILLSADEWKTKHSLTEFFGAKVNCESNGTYSAIVSFDETNFPELKGRTIKLSEVRLKGSGNYGETIQITFQDPNLIPSNISNGVSIYGVVGTLVANTSAAPSCIDNLLNSQPCTTSVNRYVTSTLGTDVSGVNASLFVTIPAGYYNGSTKATMSDTNLINTNIKNGVNLFGVNGTLVPAYAACTNNIKNSSQCSAPANSYVSDTLGGNISGANGSLSASIPTGFYNATQTATMSDTNLIAGNIKNGVTIFGVSGSATGPYANCVDDTNNGSKCSTLSAGRYVTAALCASPAQTTGTGCYAPVNSWISASEYNGRETNCTTNNSGTCWISQASKSALDGDLSAGNIKAGIDIFGILGTYISHPSETLSSNVHKDKTTSSITQAQEVTAYTGLSLPTNYREVPDISKDDDGYSGTSVTYVNRTGWATTTCGTSGSLAARIANCAANGTIGPNASWDGTVKGNAGMGSWKLVTRGGACGTPALTGCKEVWQDQRTGLLWSSIVNNKNTLNWCKSSGSNNSATVTLEPKADDPSNYCDVAGDGPNQNNTSAPISACYEHYQFDTTFANDLGKASLNMASSPSIRWRLPTIYDYEQANVNGIRFVLPDMGKGPRINNCNNFIGA